MAMKRGPKPKPGPPVNRPPQVRTPGAMAAPLAQLLSERHLTARGLSLRCGLAGDTVRNLLSGRAHSPRGEVAQALADELKVSVAQLYGREPLPEVPTKPDIKLAQIGHFLSEAEFSYPRDGNLVPASELKFDETAIWRLPPNLLVERGMDSRDAVVVRAPENGDGFSQGDRLLLDRADRAGSPHGLHLLSDGYGLRAARCGVVRGPAGPMLRVEGRGGVEELRIGVDIEIVGRLVGRWQWL